MSFVIGGLDKQYIDIATKRGQGPHGTGEIQVVIENKPCRFVEGGISKFDVHTKAPIIFGKAVIWMVGDVDVKKGMLVIVKETSQVYTIVDVIKPRDVIVSARVDHTRCVLE